MSDPDTRPSEGRGWYVYGVGPADIRVAADVRGVGDPPAEVLSVQYGDVAALTSRIRLDRPLGTPQDLMAHEHVLDSAAAKRPILPYRFGAVLDSEDAVAEELLAPHHDVLLDALRSFEGLAQYFIHGRYIEAPVLRDVLSQNREAAQLRVAIRDLPDDATRPERMRLGEIIAEAIFEMREEDTFRVIGMLESVVTSVTIREPSHELDAANVAVLVQRDREVELENAVRVLATNWADRVRFRLLGPMAPYDFTGEFADDD